MLRALCCITVLAAVWSAGLSCSAREQVEAAPCSADTVAPEILRSIPHDTLAFTQGLLVHERTLLESTGAPLGRRSSLRVLSLENGDVRWRAELPQVFAEGIAVLGTHLVQLTWQQGSAMVYELPSMAREAVQLAYDGEGWGLASDQIHFYMSNGTDTVYVRNRAFGLVATVPVRLNGRPLRSLNELEFAHGMLYANIWYSTFIAEIDPRSGAVARLVDCRELFERTGPMPEENVLNGIAHDPSRDVFYLTGKNWPLLFEVRLPPPRKR